MIGPDIQIIAKSLIMVFNTKRLSSRVHSRIFAPRQLLMHCSVFVPDATLPPTSMWTSNKLDPVVIAGMGHHE